MGIDKAVRKRLITSSRTYVANVIKSCEQQYAEWQKANGVGLDLVDNLILERDAAEERAEKAEAKLATTRVEIVEQTRKKLPARRAAVTFNLAHQLGLQILSDWKVTIGFDHDGNEGSGSIGEVFIESKKDSTSEIGILARDAAVLISIALQYGVPIDVIADAVSRTQIENGEPQTIIGTTLDALRAHGPLLADAKGG